MLPQHLEYARRTLADIVDHVNDLMLRGLTAQDLPHYEVLERARETLHQITNPGPRANYHALYTADRFINEPNTPALEAALQELPTDTIIQDRDDQVWRKHKHHSTTDHVWSAATSHPTYHNRSSLDLRALQPFRILHRPGLDPTVRTAHTSATFR